MNPKLRAFVPVIQAVASLSRNPKRAVGAGIFTCDFSLVATGFNDLSKGVPHVHEMYSQPNKDKYLAHAEENAIAQAAKYGHATHGCILLTTGLQPCSRCARLIVQAGIMEVYYPALNVVDPKWEDDFIYARNILNYGGVRYESY